VSLRAKLLFLVIIAVLPAICIEIYGEAELRSTRQEEIRVEASRLMRLAVAEQERINEGARQLLVAFSALPAVHIGNWAECQTVAAQILSRVNGYLNIGVASAEGDLLCSALPVPAGKPVELTPTGYHMMLFELKAPLNPGDKVPLTLNFENRGGRQLSIDVEATVRPLGADSAPPKP